MMLKQVQQTIEAYRMLAPGEPVLCALSGGADSVSLLYALRQLGYPVRAYHLNHCLRGAEADRDELFCRELCEKLAIPLLTERLDVREEAARRGEGIEAAARSVRYERLAAAAKGSKIAVAHTADDNLETMLFHLTRGTGPKGLAGIPPVRGAVIRPLIEVERDAVERYLAGIGQSFVTDSTNGSGRYTRNRIRHGVVPALRAINPAVADAAVRLSRQLRQDEDFLAHQAAAVLEQAAGEDGAFDVAVLRSAHPAVRSRALRQIAERQGMPMRNFSAVHIAALEKLLETDEPSAVCCLPYGYTARREYGLLYVGPEKPAEGMPELPLWIPFYGEIWGGKARVRIRQLENSEDFYKSFNTFCVDCGTISLESLCIRPRKTGDRIRLTEAGGSGTLKKLMIDRKIPRLRRQQLAVIADKYGVIAVQDIGMDISRRPQGGALIEIKIEG
ncbi:MAG: tRNA lysidine(34) synthetase TilS [Agathobaculum sp.]|uniref:tRNA lysidine(34) synthetase TilS n=1 Tax=Agathobaculum sp. TaxID=2048138 RepID=UPI003D8C36EA